MGAVGRENRWGQWETYAPFLLFLVSFAFLLRSTNPSFYLDDSPETITAAVLVGIPHPPGYPFHTLLGHLATFFSVGLVTIRVNLLSAAIASLVAVFVARVSRDHFGLFPLASLLMGAMWVVGATAYPAALGAKGSVYQLTALLLVATLDALLRRRLGLAAFLWGVSLGHHWMTLAALTPGLFLLACARRRPEDWTPAEAWRCAALSVMGASTILVLPLRAVLDPSLNWGDPRTLSSLLFNLSRAQYVGADLGWNPLVWARQGWVFFKTAFMEFPGWMFPALGAAIWGWRRDRNLTAALLALWVGLGLSICLYLNLGSEKEYLIQAYALPAHVLTLVLAGWGIALALERLPGKGASFRVGILVFLVAVGVTLAASRFSDLRRDRYLYDHDYALDVMKGVPRDALLYCRGDGMVFPTWFFQYVQERRTDLVAVGVDGLPMEWVRRHLMKEHPGLRVPMPTWKVGNESVPSLSRSIALENRDRALYLSYNRVTDNSFPDAKLLPYGLAPHAALPPESPVFDEARTKYLWAVMRLRGTDGPVDRFTRENLLKDYAIHRNALGVFYEDLADRMKAGTTGGRPATPEEILGVYGECLQNFQWARDYYPTDWEFSFNVGNALYNLGRKGEATREYNRASLINPDGVDIFYNWGVASFESKDYFTASKMFQKVLEMDPSRKSAQEGLDYLKTIGFLQDPGVSQP